MTDTYLQRLAALFGEKTFTSAEAHRALDAGLGAVPSLRSFANALRAAVDRQVKQGPRSIALRHAGYAHNRQRRWRFAVIAPPAGSQEPVPADPNEDLL